MGIAALPVGFRRSSEQRVSYDWADLTSGIGIMEFYAMENTHGDNLLISKSGYENGTGVIATINTSPVYFITAPFSITQTFNGTGYISAVWKTGGAGSWYVTYEVYSSNAAGDTLISSSTRTQTSSGPTDPIYDFIDITFANKIVPVGNWLTLKAYGNSGDVGVSIYASGTNYQTVLAIPTEVQN